MEEVFIAIMEQIAQEMPELSLIDEDYGQLEMGAEEDQYPVTFPCVLIGNTSSDWNDLGYGVQKSESMLIVRLAIDCYDDTSYASGTYEMCIRDRLGIDTTDWNRVNEFCNNPRIVGKPFVQISTAELEQLAIKLRAIQRKGGLTDK